jgi:hypothetical protein
MKKRIAVEGLKKEIVSIICEMLKILNYDICYRYESDYKKTYDFVFDLLEDSCEIVEKIIESQPDLTLICNARCYSTILEHYSERTDIPLLLLTGGGPELIDKVKRYTPHVLEVPFKMQDLSNKIEKILG